MTAHVPAGFEALTLGGGFLGVNGPIYLKDQDGLVQVGFRVETRHTNPLGICHGGMMASFCDMLLPLVAHRRVPEIAGRFLLTVSLQVDYLGPAPSGAWVQGEAQVLRTTRSLVFAQGVVEVDGTPVARASGIMKIGQPFPGLHEAVG